MVRWCGVHIKARGTALKKKERKKDGRLAGILLESRFAAEQACEQASEGVRKARRRELADNSKLNYCDGNKMASFRGGGARGEGAIQQYRMDSDHIEATQRR